MIIGINYATVKRILRYVFFVGFILWALISIYIGYQYVWFSSEKINSKGGTFVEGIFESTSYLPYLRNDLQSKFYQGLLFNACLKYSTTEKEQYKKDLCDIKTNDNKTYEVYLPQGALWSDGTPLSLDDIFFTYNDLIIKNKWNIKGLAAYKNVKITREAGNMIKVVFPNSSDDNKLFFTNYILPKHTLNDFDIQNYREIFAIQPIYSNCANIVSQNTDQYSLIFNLVNCRDTNLNFYQIKNIISPESFQKSAAGSIIDAYIGDEGAPGYITEKLFTNKLVTVFFNTNSPKLYVRARRSLGGLIKHNFYTTGYDNYIIKNTDGLFDVFASTGGNIKDFLGRSYEANQVSKQDLLDSGVKPLPSEITVKGENQNFVFLLEDNKSPKNLKITFGLAYDKIVVINNKRERAYALDKDKKTTVTLSFGTGLNSFEVYAYKGTQKAKVALINLYNIQDTSTSTQTPGTVDVLHILYSDSPVYDFIVNQMKSIFTKAGVTEYFVFEKLGTEDLDARLKAGSYDMLITTIDMGLTKDITKLFSTDNATSNPSQYQNKKLISLLQQYTNTNGSARVLNEINTIYSTDMPLVLLGKAFVPLHVKQTIADRFFSTGIRQEIYEYNWRNVLYSSIKLVNNVQVDGTKIWNYENFSNFLNNALQVQKTPVDSGATPDVTEILSGY